MQELNNRSKPLQRLHLMDAVLYLVAGSAMTIISITFLLWLRF
jgi:hypothetical protein